MTTRTFLLAAAFLTAVPTVHTLAQAEPATPVTTTAVPTTGGVMLRYKFTPGQTRAYKFTMDSDGMLMGGPQGQGFPIKQHMDAVMRQTVKEVRPSDGAATIQVGYDSMKMTMNGQPMPMPQQAAGAMTQVGTIVMMPTGKVVSFTAAGAANGGPLGNMNSMFQNMNQGTFPEGAVKADDTWEAKVDMAAMGMKISSANTVVSADANTAHYTTAMKGTMDTASSATPSPLPITLAGTMDGTSDQTFDVAAGALATQSGTMNMDLTMTPKPGQGAGAAPPTPMKMKMKVTTQMSQLLVAPKPATP